MHGCLDLLNAAVEKFHDRHLVLLGDYVDRGPDDRGVLDRVRDLVEFGRATALMGNHDDMMIRAVLEGGAQRSGCITVGT
ncbi:metallophosphoesterase [Deinococcus malanensis]|uniref:metallophosphoesterase n=1 Tax=Deinococcus malanensis TaxID=1706855 RepID=UPI003630E500